MLSCTTQILQYYECRLVVLKQRFIDQRYKLQHWLICFHYIVLIIKPATNPRKQFKNTTWKMSSSPTFFTKCWSHKFSRLITSKWIWAWLESAWNERTNVLNLVWQRHQVPSPLISRVWQLPTLIQIRIRVIRKIFILFGMFYFIYFRGFDVQCFIYVFGPKGISFMHIHACIDGISCSCKLINLF